MNLIDSGWLQTVERTLPLPDSSDELDSWKEIAAYLKVNARTAQKWEKEQALPVRRLPGKRGRVVASKHALDEWKQNHLKAPPWWSKVDLLQAYALATSVALAAAGIWALAVSSRHWRTHPSGTARPGDNEVIFSQASRQMVPRLLDVVSTVRVGLLPISVALSGDGARAYVSNTAHQTVSVINTSTSPPSVVTEVIVGIGPCALAISPDNSLVYVPNNGDDTVSVIDTTTNRVIATRHLGGQPRLAAFTPDGRKAYVTTRGGSVAVFDTSTHNIVEELPLGDQPYGIAFTPDGTGAYVSKRSAATIALIDVTTSPPAIVGSIPVGEFPQIVTITPDGSKIYVTNLHSDSVSVIDRARSSVVATVPVGDRPYWIAITLDGKRAYVANEASNSVSVIETATDTVVASIETVVDGPRGLAIGETPAGAKLPGRQLIVGTGGSATAYCATSF